MNTPKRDLAMTVSRWPNVEQLEHVHELNRLFLMYLSTNVAGGGDGLGLPVRARRILVSTPASLLDGIAEFPRALFQIVLDDGPITEPLDAATDRVASFRHSMHLTILLCAWTLSRQSVYQARFLLGLSSAAIQRLRGFELRALPRLASAPRLLECAFATHDWFWTELLTDTRPEARRRLALIALQPGVEHEWPLQSSAHAS
jgi:hypothetical protein